MNAVRIVKLSRGTEIFFWLCPAAIKARETKGWFTVDVKKPPHELRCDDASETGCCKKGD